jgi:hypothetical protein
MLVMDAVTRMEDVDAVLARDAPASDGLTLDLVLRPAGMFLPLISPSYRIVALIPANGSIVATVTFTEQFWTEASIISTKKPQQARRHFKTIHTLIDFIRRDRRSSIWKKH